jgi:FkbM family methyltransferase
MRQSLLPYWIGQYEASSASIFRSALDRIGNTEGVVDLGANLGYYTVLGAGSRRLRGAGRVFSFEPNPRAYSELEMNIALNRFDNVELYRAAVGVTTGEGLLYDRPDGITFASLAPDDAGPKNPTRVPVYRLDDLARAWPPIGLVKLDIEGAELLALRGGLDLLKRDHPYILYEEFGDGYRRFGYSILEARCLLVSLGYRLLAIRAAPFGRALLEPVTAEPDPNTGKYGNVLAIPSERTW